MPRSRRSPGCKVVSLDARLGNSEVTLLVDMPLLDGEGDHDLVLTSDQWVSLVAKRARLGRPLHFVEIQGSEEDGHHRTGVTPAHGSESLGAPLVRRHGRNPAAVGQVRA